MQAQLRTPASSSTWLRVLVAVFALECVLVGWQPLDRKDWALENLLTLLVCVWLIWLIWRHRRASLSMTSYVLLFLFGALHEIGSHYTDAKVPHESWSAALGFSVAALFGFQRNQFDRLVHFLFGLLLLQPIRELVQQGGEILGRAQLWVPVVIISTISMLYEVMEWAAAEFFGGDLGQAYPGTQGDVWDAHKDTAAALVGSLITMAFLPLRKTPTSAQA